MKFEKISSHINQGKRNYQEDSFTFGDNYLLVSDGVGGLAKGDIASGIVTSVWEEALVQHKIVLDDLNDNVQSIVNHTIHALNNYASDQTESMGMGATLACVVIIDGQVVAIHVGDSRIYHFSKEGQIKWRSTDHSLVQELVTEGVITEEEATKHPRRNVITRVLQAKNGHETKAAVHLLDNVVTGDMVMVCSDGVIESWSDTGLSSVIMGHQEVSDIIKIIGVHCAENSGDNNTALMAIIETEAENHRIEEKISNISHENNDYKDHDIQDHTPSVVENDKPVSRIKIKETEAHQIFNQRNSIFKQKWFILTIFVVVIIIIIFLIYYYILSE